MGIVRDILSGTIDFVKEEIIPLRDDLVKAGIITPEKNPYEPKSSFVDPMSYNSVNFGYKEKFSILSYERLKQISVSDPIISAIIQTRLNEVGSFAVPQMDKYKVGFRIQMKDKDKKPSKQDKETMRELEEFVMNCGIPETFDDTPRTRKRDNFEKFLRKITRDSLIYDQMTFEVVPRRNGLPHSFYATDSTTIRLVSDAHEREEQPVNHNGYDKFDMSELIVQDKRPGEQDAQVPRYVQIVNGRIKHTYDEWEMCFGVRNPRTDLLANGYGFSELEMLITTITSHMNAETYNRRFFSQGTSIKGILAFEGQVPPDQLEAFRRQWHQQVSGVHNAWRTPILALGKESKMNFQSLHSTNREMEFGNWLEYCIKTICGVYQIDPLQIGFDISKNNTSSGAAGMNSGGNQVERIAHSRDRGLAPLLRFIATQINEYIVWRIDPNFEFEFSGVNLKTENDDLETSVKEVSNYKTVNEVRREHDLDDLPPFEEIESSGDIVLNTVWMQAYQAWQQSQMGDMGEQGGLPTAPDGSTDAETGAPDLGEEPDYENMSDEELQAELQKLESMGGNEGGLPTGQAPQETKKSFKELIL